MKASGVAPVLVLIWTTGFAGSAARTATPRPTLAPSPPAKPVAAKAKAHGIALSGRISRVDPVKKIFGVRDAAGREIPLSWTAATKVTGGELKVGETVTLRYLDKDAKHIATSIHVGSPADAIPPAATPIPVSPGASGRSSGSPS
ncbi:MAG TPA: hypothetical protein VOA00_09520 [Thermoanaerobaculia bacterium]|nr:hypothetical protein [Thermoanaerobaculia bacterium]